MRSIRALFFAVISFTALAVASDAQTTSPFDPAEPFKLTVGKSFTASGSTSARTSSQISSELIEAERTILKNYAGGGKADPDSLLRASIVGGLRTLDPHSNFFDAKEWKEMLAEEQSGYSGIGTTIGEFTRNGETSTYVLDTIAGSAAEKAKLRFGDKIIAIDGRSMKGKSIDDIREALRGTDGSFVCLTIERSATLRAETVELRRSTIGQPSIPDHYLIRPGVGYVDMSEGFTYTTYDELDSAVRELKRQGASSMILDLRGNPGGIVEQAVKVAERFLPAGSLILTQRGRSAADNRDWYSANKTPETMPLIVLTDGQTASASEIVAGAFQDNDRALIIGRRTFGKGLVQSVIDTPLGTGITLTAARYLTPSGRSIQRNYANVDLYDYYNHVTPAAAIDTPFFEARTKNGRRVFGGNGIAPDKEVAPAALTQGDVKMLDPIFFYIRDGVNGRGPTTSAAFLRDVRSTGSTDYIDLRIRYESAVAATNSIHAKRIIDASDPQILAALDELHRTDLLSKLSK